MAGNYRIDEYNELYHALSAQVTQLEAALEKRTVKVNNEPQPTHEDIGALHLAIKLVKDARWELEQEE